MAFSTLIEELQKAQYQAFKNVSADSSIENDKNDIAQILVDLSKCTDFLMSRYEGQLYELALRELQLSQLAVFGASYRQAFMGLRLALEHWFSGIKFSTNELSFRAWQLDEEDVSWSTLNDEINGVLSDRFTHIFWPQTEHRVATYRNLAKKLYRECSEYVHGNLKTHISLPKQLEYDKSTFLSWKEKLETLKLLFVYSFIIRFASILHGKGQEPYTQVALDTIGHLNEVRELFEGRN